MDVSISTNVGESSTAADAASATRIGGEGTSGPVLCPFCETELPADLLSRHQSQYQHQNQGDKDRPRPFPLAKSKPPASPLARVDTSVAADASAPSPGMLAPPRSAVTRPQITTESLKHSLDESETAENSATSAIISADDIRRWSQIAGVTFVAPPSPLGSGPASASVHTPPRSAVSAISAASGRSSAAPSPARAIPLIPPPPSAGKSPQQPGSARFGFFRGRSKLGMGDSGDGDDESDDDELGSGTGYSRVAGPGSDEDDDGYESDKPFTPKKAAPEAAAKDVKEEKEAVTIDTSAPAIPTLNVNHSITPQTPVDELRNILGEVLSRVQLLSNSHTDLLSSHSTLLTSLKIARSNLVMAEANTEMLEDELKRLKVPTPSSARSAVTSDAPRSSTEGGGPSSQLSSSTSAAAAAKNTSSSSGFGFWKKSSTSGAVASGPASPTETPTKHASKTSLDMREEEVRLLRAQIEHQSDELEALKKGKKAIEAELEGLSQALFEEANKMVSEERRRRAELEESLREVKDEREALRQTVKVLGGRVQTPAPGTPMGELGEGEAIGNLDLHYAALRRGIHHAVDGPSPAPSEGQKSDTSDNETETETEPEGDSSDGDGATGRGRSGTVTAAKANGLAVKASLETGLPETTKSPLEAEPTPWG